jgi:hypothetical protein
MADFYNDRQRSPRSDGDDTREVSRASLRDANSRIRQTAPAYERDNVNRKIRNTSVQRHRARRAGREDFGNLDEYMSFMLGADNGGD